MSNSAQQANVGFDVSEGPRIHGQKREGMLEELGDGLLLVRYGADHKRRVQPHDLIYRFHVPAIAQFRQVADRSDIRTPLGYADERALRPNGAQN